MQKITAEDTVFMRRAIELAKSGVSGRVHPNPRVGAVVVRAGRIVGEGAHERFGGPHAEVRAIESVKGPVAGSTVYVSLEPCPIFGKTPPCTDLLIRSGVKKVVVGALDPNPKVSGRGIKALKKAGLEVISGVLAKEAGALNRDFAHFMRTGLPYVVVKSAQSLDGKIATRSGKSKWITCEASRRAGHRLRADADAILVGVNTILADDPLLSVRVPGVTPQPFKIVLDSALKTSPRANIFSKASPGPVILAVTRAASRERRKLFDGKAQILETCEKNGRVDLRDLCRRLAARGIVNLLVEGGGETVGAFVSKKLASEAYFFVAPILIGGKAAPGSVGGEGVSELRHAARLKNWSAVASGDDLLIQGEF
jgi:diaminohydroxyphosphoribosylaminopyrimidine deaminase/5-amino-6-(5-phosphoribosylamino)uracil reductase